MMLTQANHYTVVWSGRGSIHDVFLSERDILLWQTRRSVVMDEAPGQSGFPTCKEMRTQDFDKRAERVQKKTAQARKAGHCTKCFKRPSRAGRWLCKVCGEAAAARARRRR